MNSSVLYAIFSLHEAYKEIVGVPSSDGAEIGLGKIPKPETVNHVVDHQIAREPSTIRP